MMRYAQPRSLTQILTWHGLALAAIFLAGLFLRLYGLGSESLWFDEALSFKIAQMDSIQIIFSTREDPNPPFYYLILHYWILLAGDSEFALRVPSAIAGALAIPVIYSIGSVLFSRAAGLMAALILSLSAYHIRYSQEARTYSLMVFLGLLSFYFFLKLLKEPRSRSTTAGYVVSTTLLMYSHMYGIFLIGAQILYMLATRQDLRRWVVPAAFVALLYVPGVAKIAVNLLLPQGAWKSSMGWVPTPTLAHLLDFFVLYSGSIPLVIAFVLLSALGLFDLVRSEQGSTAWLLLAWLLVPIVVPFVVSHLYRPMLLDRYTIAASPAFYLLVARGVEGLGSVKYSSVLVRARILFAIGVIVFSLAAALDYYTATTKEPWRQVAGYVDGHAKPGDLILFYNGSGRFLFDYYSQREDVPQEVASVESSSPPVTRKEMREELAPAVEGHRRVWLVRHWADNPHINKLLRKSLVNSSGGVAYQDVYNGKIDDPYKNWSTWYFQDHIVLFLFAERRTQ